MKRDERGSAAIEAVVVGPAVILLIGLVILGGRVALAHQTVQSVAADTARAASLERTTSRAQASANTALETGLRQQPLCSTYELHLDLNGFKVPAGRPASTSATVTCRVSLSDIAVPGLPGTITIQATMTSPIDTYRERK